MTATTLEGEVIGTLNEFMGAWAKRDIHHILSYFAPSSTLSVYGTGIDEKRVGLAEIRTQIERDFSQSEALGGTLDWNLVGVSGNVAWTASDVTLTVTITGMGEMSFPARLTTVMQNYDGRWLMEHFHLSVPAANQEEGESF